MSYKKELSKCCVKCGVEWLEDFSNKTPKRALCLECKRVYDKEYSIRSNANKKRLYNRTQKGKSFKVENRKTIWKEVNNEIKSLKTRQEWLPFIQNKMIEILNNKELMDYLNDTDILDKFNKEK